MTLFKRYAEDKPSGWYYCLKHGKVEEGPQCRAADRLGPYDTREEADHAMQTARERNEEWQQDPRWSDEPSDDSSGSSEGDRPS